MKTSETTKEIYPAIIAVQSQMQTIPRDKDVKVRTQRGPEYSFKYAPLDSIMEYIKPLFAARGLAVVQAVDKESLTTRLIHTSGEWIESETHLNRDHANMQGFGGEVTYKRRYALSALIGLVSDDDNDAPKVRKLRNGAVEGIGDDLPEDWKTWLRDLSDDVASLCNAGNADKAADLIKESNLDNEQLIYMERHLDSKVRTALRNLQRPQ